MALGNNSVFWYQRANNGCGHQGDDAPPGTPVEDFHLMSVSLDPTTGFAITDHGLIQDQSGRLVWRVPSMMTDGHTSVFMTGDWWLNPGDVRTLEYEYNDGVESYVPLDRGEFFAVATNVNNNTAPAITSALATTFTVGSQGTFTVTAAANPAPLLSESGDLPMGVSFSTATGVLSGIPVLGSNGVYPLVFTASNGVGASYVQNFQLTVSQPVVAPQVTFQGFDTATEGNWQNSNGKIYGTDGYVIEGGSQSLPSYVTQFSSTGGTAYTWVASTSDQRALINGNGSGRVAGTLYSYSSFSFDVNFGEGSPHEFAVYALDWDSGGRVETITITDATTNALLDTRTVSSFSQGVYLAWNIAGHVKITVALNSGANAVISGAFFQ